MVSSVEYLGYYVIDDNDLHPVPDELKAVRNTPISHNVAELKAYLGLLTYYSKYLSNMASTLSPLYQLLHNNVKWQWTSSEAKVFQESKNLLTVNSLLVHYNLSQQLTLMCDVPHMGWGLFYIKSVIKGLKDQLCMLHTQTHTHTHTVAG